MQQSAVAVLSGPEEREAPRQARGVTLSHWTNRHPSMRYVLETGHDDYAITVCLQTARVELRAGAACLFDGILGAGSTHVTGPGRRIEAGIQGPHDLIHLHVPRDLLEARLRAISSAADGSDLDGRTLQDPLIGQLGRLLRADDAANDTAYEGAVAYTLLTHILRLAQECSSSASLPKWRMRRVQAFIEQNLSQPLSLRDLAAAAGLSRMYFAAQFKTATGCSPHHYLLCQRIEAAKTLLAESDLSLVEIASGVGFMAQAHFTTVFKRLAGETPARWRRTHRDMMAGAL